MSWNWTRGEDEYCASDLISDLFITQARAAQPVTLTTLWNDDEGTTPAHPTLTSDMLNMCKHRFMHPITSCQQRPACTGRDHPYNRRSPILGPLHSTAMVMESLDLLRVPPIEPPALGTSSTSADIVQISPDWKSVQGGGALGQSTRCPLPSHSIPDRVVQGFWAISGPICTGLNTGHLWPLLWSFRSEHPGKGSLTCQTERGILWTHPSS